MYAKALSRTRELQCGQYGCLYPGCEYKVTNEHTLAAHVSAHFSLIAPQGGAFATNNIGDMTYGSIPDYFNGPTVATATVVAPTFAVATLSRLTCSHPSCTNLTFARASDLVRHMKKHQPSARRFWCSVAGCKYSSGSGFYRRDKLVSHQRNAHGV